MRFVFLNRFYWPDEPATSQLLTDLAEAIAARGHSVTVITSRRSRDIPRREVRRGVTIRRVRSTRLGSKSIAGRGLDYATFLVGAMVSLLFTARRGDVVVPMTDPPILGLLAWPCARLRGAKLVHWLQDIYPEIAMELTQHRWLRVLRPWRDAAWKSAERCVVLGQDMADLARERGVEPSRLVAIPNWAPEGVQPASPDAVDELKRAWGLGGKFVAGYSGNLGRVHDLFPLLDVAEALRHDPDIVFLFIGSGAQRAALEERVRASGLRNVQFRPAQPRAKLSLSLSLPDVHFVTVLPGCERLVFPSKLHGIAAAGRPMIVVAPADSELAALARTRGFGAAFSREETDAIASHLRVLKQDPSRGAAQSVAARVYAQTSGGAREAAAQWEAMLDGSAHLPPFSGPVHSGGSQ